MARPLRRTAPIAALGAAASIAIAALAGGATTAAAEACAGATARVSQVERDVMIGATLCLLNRERARHGLTPLRLSSRLSVAARRHSRDMVRRHYFSHTSRSGASFVTRIKRTGYLRAARSWSVGENIGWGSGAHSTPSSMVEAWMDSPGHRRNVLGRFRHVGIGIRAGSPAGGYADAATYTTDFGRR
jgi:uncharacterized protein YkwD